MHVSLPTSFVALAILAGAMPQSIAKGIGRVIPITKRSVFLNSDQSIDTIALTAHRASVEAKILRGLANFERNTGKTNSVATNNPEKRGAGEPLTEGYSGFWYGNISVGTPAKSFTVHIDTGSSDLFIPGSDCDLTCHNHTLWNPSSSSTSKLIGKTTSIQYADGKEDLVLEEYTDTVSIAGFTAKNQTLGVAKNYTTAYQYPYSNADGLIGMAFQSISHFNASPVFETLVSENVIEPVFSLKLSRSGAELYLGGTNHNLYTGDFAYAPVTVPGFWQVNMDSVQGNGRTVLKNVSSIIGTMTNFIYGSSSQVAALHGALGGKPVPGNLLPGYYTYPCDRFPNISFTFGSRPFSIPASALNIGKLNSTDCVSGIVEYDNSITSWVIGDLFLQGVYTTFDLGNMSVGFAQLA